MRFSVIVPLHNKSEYVAKALRSIAAQTFSDFEAIIVDDGSTDGSFEVAQDVIKSIPVHGFRIYRQKNAGVSATRNYAASIAAGEYLCFLDADDWWAPTFLERMSAFIDDYPEAGIYGTSYYYVKSGREQIRVNIPSGYFNYCKVYSSNLQMPLWTGAVSVPSPVFKEMGGFNTNLSLGEDFDLWIRIALKYKTAFLNSPLSYYNQDVNISQRGIGHLHDPKRHILWNLDYLSQKDSQNQDLKQLLDNLRVYGLMPYFLSSQYHEDAVRELKKVDWNSQPASVTAEYKKPLWLLRSKTTFMKCASKVKQSVIKCLK